MEGFIMKLLEQYTLRESC